MKKVLYKSASLLLSTALLGVTPCYSALNDISVISSSESEFHFVFKVDRQLGNLDQLVGADSMLYLSRAVQIGVPYGAKPKLVSVNTRNPMTLDRGYLGSGNRNRTFAAIPVARLSEVWTMRGRQFVTVVINPAVEGAVYGEVDITISFDGSLSVAGASSSDPKFERIFATSIANWDRCKNWPQIPGRAAKAAQLSGPFGYSADWYKLSVNRTGMHSITFDDLRAAGFTGNAVSSQTIYLFNAGGMALNPLLQAPRPQFNQVAIKVEDGNDGNFETGDRILFFGESVNRWVYDSAGATYIKNIYTDKNIYWLALSSFIPETPLRMNTVSVTPTGTAIDTMVTYTEYVHAEQDLLLRQFNNGLYDNYYNWYWSFNDTLTVFVQAQDRIPGQTVDIFIAARTVDTTGVADAIGYVDLTVNGQSGLSKNCDRFSCTYQADNLVSGLNDFSMRLWGDSTVQPYFDYLEFSYDRQLVPLGDRLDVAFGAYNGLVRVEVADNFTSVPLLFNLDDPAVPVQLTGAERLGGQLSFEADFTGSLPNRFYAVGSANLLRPSAVSSVAPTDLYAAGPQTDVIIVTTQALASAMGEYINYRGSQGYTFSTVTVSDVMDNFAFGLYDPTAIRDFLKFAYENYPSPAPSIVIFVGDGNYDFLDRQRTGVPNFVPPYLLSFDFTVSDDNYIYFGEYGLLDSDTTYLAGGDRGFDMMSARWPVRSAAEIDNIVAKMKRYESSTTFGSWRSGITFVADDEIGTFDDETFHVIQTEDLARRHIPNFINRDKIYLWEHPLVNGEKPTVNDAIVNAVNQGTLILNYVGHGSPDLWAHEHVFNRASDLPRLTNSDHLPLVFTASCAIGFFDDPRREGMAEDLLVMNGGAISVVSATRLVYSSDNAAFNRQVFDIMLYNDSLTMCEATYTAKLLRQYAALNPPSPVTNDRNYLYFGDPFLKLGLPPLRIQTDSTLDSLTALQPVRITGSIVDKTGNPYISDGQLTINVYDSEREKTYRLVNDNGQVIQEIDYNTTGPTIYRGSASVTNGTFDFTFIPPLDIGYGGNGAQVSLYALLDSIDAIGVLDSVAVTTNVVASTDSVGPVVDIMFSGKPLQPGGNVIRPGDQLNISLSDSSGINLTGGLGHGITLEVDGDPTLLINLTGLFQYNLNDYTSGKLDYDLSQEEPGLHSFKLKAWDNANNSTVLDFTAEIVVSSQFAIRDLMNYPNPMVEKTSFSFSLTQAAEKLSLEIFTLAGRKINTFNRYTLAPAYYDDIIWDGRDAYGDRVATGVYIYKATAVPLAGGKTIQEFGKVVVIN